MPSCIQTFFCIYKVNPFLCSYRRQGLLGFPQENLMLPIPSFKLRWEKLYLFRCIVCPIPRIHLLKWFLLLMYLQVLSFTHPTSFHSAETYESLLQCLRMEDDKVAEAAIQIFRNTGHKIETDLPQIRS